MTLQYCVLFSDEKTHHSVDMPRLILPSVQVNMLGGQLPPPESNSTRHLKLPLDVL
ncbi:hypothetical protein SAMN05444678_1346 [Sphingomonas sp. YR710]|nr:hypothetical protein SAMN05444678_1346 [Sphingomonas sp. YR710]